ncbi:MAG: hypothetical protein RMI94_00715 [Bryobacterales bacterium]|nr:hypothetical protein [Bryobacteraceae bacterium]MDW8129042.1 hypothetical protein [Bryobacterales bacterium]
MGRFAEPLAFRIWRMHREGLTVQEIAARLGLPPDRVRTRLRAVAKLGEMTQWVHPADTASHRSSLLTQ